MSAPRDLVHAPALQVLKSASKALVRAFGGQDAAAALIGCRQQRMSDCGLANTPDFLRIDEVEQLEQVTQGLPGAPHVTRALAAATGHVLIKLPQTQGAGDWLSSMGMLAKEAGDITSSIAVALADGSGVSADEARDILRECDEAVAALMAVRALAEAVSHG